MEMRDLKDFLLEKKAALYFLISKTDEKCNALVAVPKTIESKIDSNLLVDFLRKSANYIQRFEINL